MLGQGSLIGQSRGVPLFSPPKTKSSTGAVSSPTSNAVYGAGAGVSTLSGSPTFLLVLVFLEALALVSLRRGFKNHHGG